MPAGAADREYLGLPPGATGFGLEEIRCEILVIDCFDMYCHVCQAGAKHVNELYRLAQERGLGVRVKFLGLGLGDTPLEVTTYRDKFQVPFPVFPDRKSAIARQFGPARLPNLLILRNQGRRLEVLHTSPGLLLDPAGVLSHIQAALEHPTTHYRDETTQAAQATCDSACSASRMPDSAALGTDVRMAPSRP